MRLSQIPASRRRSEDRSPPLNARAVESPLVHLDGADKERGFAAGRHLLLTTAAEDLLELVLRRYERASTIPTSNRPVEDRGKFLGDTAAVTALLDRFLHHAHVLKCGPRSWRTKVQTTLRTEDAVR